MKFLFDNNLSPALAKAVDALVQPYKHSALPLRDKFAQNATDEYWLSELGKESDWAVISGDYRIARNPHEKAAWLEADVPIFFLKKGWHSHRYWDKAWHLVRWMPHVIEQAERIQGGAGFWVPVKCPARPRFEQVRLR